jgi:hypothetical protein
MFYTTSCMIRVLLIAMTVTVSGLGWQLRSKLRRVYRHLNARSVSDTLLIPVAMLRVFRKIAPVFSTIQEGAPPKCDRQLVYSVAERALIITTHYGCLQLVCSFGCAFHLSKYIIIQIIIPFIAIISPSLLSVASLAYVLGTT